MSRRARERSYVVHAVLLASLGIVACHHVATSVASRNSTTRHIAMLRIGGPVPFVLHPGDSVVLVVNDREAWRGVYDPSSGQAGLQAAIDHAIPGTDSVVSSRLWVDHDVAARYHIGGKRAGVIVVRTSPPPE